MKKNRKINNFEKEADREIIGFDEKVANNNKFYYLIIGIVALLLIILFLVLHFTDII